MAWLSPRTWIAGELVTDTLMNAHVRDQLNSLKGEHNATQAFRGVHVRTHPDNDVALNKVMLVRADEIVMHDGTRVADWNALVADITASGAGGLDTGSEAASTWYEIHAIRKSSDATRSLLLHRSKDHFKDQEQTTVSASRALRVATGTATDNLAQSFTVATAGPVPFVDVHLNRNNAVTGNVWFTLQADSAGVPGSVLATSEKIDASPISATASWIRLKFHVPPSLSTSTTYHLVMWADYTRSDTNHIAWFGNPSSSYANGLVRNFNGSSWATNSVNIVDAAFRIYVVRNDTAVVMPSGYDQRALIGFVFNGGGSNFVRFSAIDRQVRFDWPAVSSVLVTSSAVPVLTDLSSYVPPRPAHVDLVGQASGGQWLGARALPEGYDSAIRIGPAVVAGAGSAYTEFAQPAPAYLQAMYLTSSSGSATFWVAGYRW